MLKHTIQVDTNRLKDGFSYSAVGQIDGIKGEGLQHFYMRGKLNLSTSQILCAGNSHKPHPGFVVLDSPLVTFRGADSSDEDEAISDDMKEHFYTELSKTVQNRQIIIIENDDPPEEILENLHFIHFTKDESRGRYGFIPKTV